MALRNTTGIFYPPLILIRSVYMQHQVIVWIFKGFLHFLHCGTKRTYIVEQYWRHWGKKWNNLQNMYTFCWGHVESRRSETSLWTEVHSFPTHVPFYSTSTAAITRSVSSPISSFDFSEQSYSFHDIPACVFYNRLSFSCEWNIWLLYSFKTARGSTHLLKTQTA